MKTITRRLSEVERRFAAHRDERGRSIAEVIRERRRQRLEAAGRPFEAGRAVKYAGTGNQPRTIGEAILRARAARRAASK